jgi:hypothetical protein
VRWKGQICCLNVLLDVVSSVALVFCKHERESGCNIRKGLTRIPFTFVIPISGNRC